MSTPISTPHLYAADLGQMLGDPIDLKIFLKQESQQQGRSIKGRVAYAMAMRSRQIGRPIIESSSGNLALGLGYWCGQLGAPRPRCLIDDCCEPSMIDALDEMGCVVEVVPLTHREREQQSGVLKRISRAREYVREGYYWPNQYDSAEWIKVHQETTGPEIWCDDRRYDLVVGAVGTGATMSGVALARPADSRALVVAVEPAGSSIFGAPAGPYRVAGAGNPFKPQNYRQNLIDIEVTVDDDSAFLAARTLRAAGLNIGSSGAMTVVGALRAARQLRGTCHTAVVI